MKPIIKIGVEMSLDELMRMEQVKYDHMTNLGYYVFTGSGVHYIAEIKENKAIIFALGESWGKK